MGEPEPVRKHLGDRIPFTFPSRVTLDWPECNTVHGELFLLPDRRPAPVAVLLHGNGARSPAYERYRARQLLANNVHVARFCWAGHMDRIPAGEHIAEHTLAADVAGCVQTFVQAAADAADLVTWLRAQPFTKEVGMAGWSGGGITTLLAMSLVPLDFAMPVVPATDLGWTLTGPYLPANARTLLLEGGHERVRSATRALDAALRVPDHMPERFLLVAGARDEVCGVVQTQRLWEAWGRPPIRWTRYGHMSGCIFGVRRPLTELATNGPG